MTTTLNRVALRYPFSPIDQYRSQPSLSTSDHVANGIASVRSSYTAAPAARMRSTVDLCAAQTVTRRPNTASRGAATAPFARARCRSSPRLHRRVYVAVWDAAWRVYMRLIGTWGVSVMQPWERVFALALLAVCAALIAVAMHNLIHAAVYVAAKAILPLNPAWTLLRTAVQQALQPLADTPSAASTAAQAFLFAFPTTAAVGTSRSIANCTVCLPQTIPQVDALHPSSHHLPLPTNHEWPSLSWQNITTPSSQIGEQKGGAKSHLVDLVHSDSLITPFVWSLPSSSQS